MSKPLIIVLITLGFIVFLFVLAGTGIMWLSSREYRPDDWEVVEVIPALSQRPVRFQPIELYSWNIGYASLDAKQDFFMDGGEGVRPAYARNVEENMWAIQAYFSAVAPDIIFLQEVDVNSKRSYGVNQADYFSETWKGSSAFALNFKCPFVPVPFPHFIGKVESGLLTLNSYGGTAERISLPSSFSWPERIAQLKRCLLVQRLPIQENGNNSSSDFVPPPGAELVLVNLHLEAFDTGGVGRTAQTRVLAEFLKAEYAKGNYVIAGGDFNQVFPDLKDVFPMQKNDYFTPGIVDDSLFGEDWIFAADPSAPSCRSLDKPYDGSRENHEFYIIDGFILSPNVELISVQTQDLDFKNSDHNPVKLTFSLK
ncbi:MAG: endonuclease/exonuclease/phosphatase family protein [Treponema sp.]|nr:endonuclease/exonuclease/phosphatase family protein [Treponema sp.]